MSILKKALPVIVTGVFAGLFIVLSVFISAGGFINGSVHGFALDAEENLYIGTDQNIQVYAAGERIREIRPFRALGHDYRFVIQDHTLIIGSQKWKYAKIYDLNGKYLSDSDLHFENIRDTAESRSTVELNGNLYAIEIHGGFAPAEVLQNGETIYQMSFWDFLFTGFPAFCIRVILWGLFAVSLLAFVTDEEVKAYLKKVQRL